MLGWRAKLGLLVPSGNQVVEPELMRVAPEGVTVHSTRITNYLDTPEELAAMKDEVPAAARLLGHAEVAAIAFACTGGSLLQGAGYDRTISALIKESSGGIPATTTSTAVVEALRHLGVRRLIVVTPYQPWLNKRVAAFLQAADLEVVRIEGIPNPSGLQTATAVSSISPNVTAAFTRSVAAGQHFDALFISCTSLRTVEAIEQLEHDLGAPVVSSNQATLWALLRLAGVRSREGGLGRLFQDTVAG